MGLLSEAKPVDEIPAWIKLMVYGPPGVGKTSWVSDAPNPVWIDFERSSETLRYIGKGHIPVVKPKTNRDLINLPRELKGSEFKTVVFDSISQMQDFHLDQHMAAKVANLQDVNRFLPLFKEFRISTEVMKYLFRELQDAEVNVVLIAHDRIHTEKKESSTKEIIDRPIAIRPDMTPRVNDSVSRLLNACFYYDKETSLQGVVKRKLYLNSQGLILAKNRLGRQEIYLENPSWKDVFKDEQ